MDNMNYKDKLIKAGVIKKGHFKLPDGRHSDVHIDKDAICCNPKLFELTIHNLIALDRNALMSPISELGVDIITGPDLAGSILAAPIALRTGKGLVFLEKEASIETSYDKDMDLYFKNLKYDIHLPHTHAKEVEGKKVLLITDIITTGKRVMETIRCIEKVGGEVVEIRCIWNRLNYTAKTQYRRRCVLPGSQGRITTGGQFCNAHQIPCKEIRCDTCDHWAIDGMNIPILSIIDDPIESWEPEECPLCNEPLSVPCPSCGKAFSGYNEDDIEDGRIKNVVCGYCGENIDVNFIPITSSRNRKGEGI